LDRHIALIPAGDPNTASSRIRVFQLHAALADLGVRSEIGFSDSADVWFVQKRLTEELLAAARAGKAMGRRIVYDVDDLGAALWYWAPKELFQAMLELADHITTATVEQGMALQEQYGVERWTAIANCIDYFPKDAPFFNPRPDSGETRVIWFGNAGNFRLMTKYAEPVMGMEGVKLVAVVGEREVEKLRRAYPDIEFHGWTFPRFLPLLRSCDLAVLAHDGSEDDRKKGNNRMITAIHYGVPAVVSRTPEYVRTALSLDVAEALFSNRAELLVAVERLRSAEARQSYLRRAQGKCWERYSPETVARQFLRVFRA
jgi:hypothetical protein